VLPSCLLLPAFFSVCDEATRQLIDQRLDQRQETLTFLSSMSVCRSISRICSTVMPYHSSIHAKHSRWHAKNSALSPCMRQRNARRRRALASGSRLNDEGRRRDLWTCGNLSLSAGRRTAMMQSSRRSPRPHMGASMVTSLYVVITGWHES
jgi:hypothetical protein